MNNSPALHRPTLSTTSTKLIALSTPTEWEVLIVSASFENRKTLLGVLDPLVVSVFSVATIEQGRDVLMTRSIAVVFCDESLSDGSYRQLLETVTTKHKATRFVVMLNLGEWKEYLGAMRSGATDVIRCPLKAIEVELVLMRANRDKDRLGFDVMA